MNGDLDKLLKMISDLGKELAKYSISSIAQIIGSFWISQYPMEEFQKMGLSSPLKQSLYFLGLALNTEEPKGPLELSGSQWLRLCRKVEDIFTCYIDFYYPKDGEHLTEQEWKEREITWMTLLHYFYSTRFAGSQDQFIERMHAQFVPFDAQLSEALGFSMSEAIGFINSLVQELEKSLSKFEAYQRSVRQIGYTRFSIQLLQQARERGFSVELKSLQPEKAQSNAQKIWQHLASQRPRAGKDVYPTSELLIEKKPIIELQPGVGLVPVPIAIYYAVYNLCWSALEHDSYRQKFFRHREKLLELRSFTALSEFFKNSKLVRKNLYETSDLQYEHDIIIIHANTLIICEAKASLMREPLRDSRRSFTRIRDDFRRDSGIQGAYEQARRLREQILSGQQVTLYDGDRSSIHVDSTTIETVIIICITDECFGALASNLNLLLDKRPEETFPWVVSIDKLVLILEAIKYRGWEISDLISFIEQRISLHGKIFTDDELDCAGIYIRNRTLESLSNSEADVVVLEGSNSDVFDVIHRNVLGSDNAEILPGGHFKHIRQEDVQRARRISPQRKVPRRRK